MTEEISEEEIYAWALKNYPSLAGNKDLAKKIYNIKVLHNREDEVSRFPFKKISELQLDGRFIVIKVVALDKPKIVEYVHCVDCNSNRICFNPEHKKIKGKRVQIFVMDETGTIEAIAFANEDDDLYNKIEDFYKSDIYFLVGKLSSSEKYGENFVVKVVVPIYPEDDALFVELEKHLLLNGAKSFGENESIFNEFIAKNKRMKEIADFVGVKNVGGKIIWN